MSGEGIKEGLGWFVKLHNADEKMEYIEDPVKETLEVGKYMEGPVKETLEDGKAVLKSGHVQIWSFFTWISSFFSL